MKVIYIIIIRIRRVYIIIIIIEYLGILAGRPAAVAVAVSSMAIY